jgi:hypothetical protein
VGIGTFGQKGSLNVPVSVRNMSFLNARYSDESDHQTV